MKEITQGHHLDMDTHLHSEYKPQCEIYHRCCVVEKACIDALCGEKHCCVA